MDARDRFGRAHGEAAGLVPETSGLADRIRDRIGMRLTRFTCQSVPSIERLYTAYDLSDLCGLAMERARADGLLTGIWTPLARLERLARRRHRIVHVGDFNARDRYAGISPEATGREMRLVHGFVTGAERVISERLEAPRPDEDVTGTG